MAARCEMCGAKIREGDLECRDCAAPPSEPIEIPLVAAAAPTAPVPASPMAPPAAGPTDSWASPDPIDDFEPPKPKVGLWLAIGAAAIAVIGTGVFLAMSGSEDPPGTSAVAERPQVPDSAPDGPKQPAADPASDAGECPELQALAGRWSFITEVTGARVVQSSGLNGFYTLDVTLEGCTATANLVKTGYTARKFTEKRLQAATATLELGEGPWASMATATFEPKSDVGSHGAIEMAFVARDDGKLSGVYRQRGSRWADTGLSGFLHGVHNEGDDNEDYPRDPILADQPCAVRCNIVCDAAQREAVPDDAFSSCTNACGTTPAEPARCGDASPATAEQQLVLAGPGPLKRLCKKAGGCAKKLGRGHATAPRIAADRLPDGWSEVTMVRSKKEGGPRLALHGPKGWYLSGPLLDISRSTKLGLLRLYARQLGEGDARRFVLGLARAAGEDGAESFFACRLSEQPTCIHVDKARSDYVSALPEGTFSVGSVAAVHTW